MASRTTSRLGDLTDKVCVVTGGGSGIGRALARRFATAGMRVAIGDVEVGALDATVAELGGDGDRVLGVRCDVRRIEDVQRLRDQTVKRFVRPLRTARCTSRTFVTSATCCTCLPWESSGCRATSDEVGTFES